MSDKSREDYGGWAGAAVATYFGGPQYAEAGKQGGEYLMGMTNGSDGKDTDLKDIGMSAGEGYMGGEASSGGYGDYIGMAGDLLGGGGDSGDDSNMSETAKGLLGEDDSSGSSMDQYAQYASLLGDAVSFGSGLFGNKKKKKEEKEKRRENEQSSMRREASYRQNRALLLDQIDQFYKKRGWDMPETNFPGQGTSRPLPGDQNPYAGYDVAPSRQTHMPLGPDGKPTKFDPMDPNSTVQQASAKPMTEGELALRSSGPNVEQARIAASQFKPVNQGKALRANLMAQGAGEAMTPTQVQDPMTEQVPQADAAPQFVRYDTQPRTAMPTMGTLGNTGRRRYGY